MTPHTVPNSPMKGVTDPVVASHGMYLSTLRTSSPAASCMLTVTALRLVILPVRVSGADLAFDLAVTGAVHGFQRRTAAAHLPRVGKSSVGAEDAKE